MSRTGALDWLLDDLVTRVAQIEKAVILSRDGLAIGASSGLSRDDSEHLSAVAAGFQSLARGVGQHFGGGQPRQTIVEMESAFLFVTAAGEGSCLAVLSAADAVLDVEDWLLVACVLGLFYWRRLRHNPPHSA